MLYATIPGAIVMFFVNLLIGIPTLGLGLLVTIPIGPVWAGVGASSHNKGLGMYAQSAAVPAMQPAAAAQTPAGWYPDPDGGNRQRYWDGRQWTSHYHAPESTAKPREPTKIEAGIAAGGEERLVIRFPAEGSDAITCSSCGNELGAEHQFLPLLRRSARDERRLARLLLRPTGVRCSGMVEAKISQSRAR
jgi:Protein of unknown function (DUF2510)